MGMFMAIWFLFVIAIYVYIALAFQKIAEKTGTEDGWWAWIPILNILLMLKIARKPLWWILLLLIPLVNLIILIIVFMAIAEACRKPSWLGILMIVPIANLIIPGYLAFSD